MTSTGAQSLRVMVTGATGFIGREVVRELANRSHEVVALVRGPDSERRLGFRNPGVRVRAGDLDDPRSLLDAVQGADVVVHFAAIVDPALQTSDAALLRVNCDAAVELAKIARESGVRRFVFASSIAAMGFFSATATSDSPCRPDTAYGRSKLEAERRLSFLRTTNFDVVSLRFPTVYGPNERYNFLALTRAIDRGVFRLIGPGDNVMPLCTSTNAARAACGAAEGKLSSGVYLVADSERYSILRIHRAVLAALGKSEPLLRIPRSLARAAGAANEIASRVFSAVPTVLSRARVRTLTADQPFDVSPVLRAGIELDAPLEEWVKRTVEDYRVRGVLTS